MAPMSSIAESSQNWSPPFFWSLLVSAKNIVTNSMTSRSVLT